MKKARVWLVIVAILSLAALSFLSPGCGSTEAQARGILDKADAAIRKAAAENLTWHYQQKQVQTMEGDYQSGSSIVTIEGDVEPPENARMKTDMSGTGDLTSQLPIFGRVTTASGDKAYGQEAISVDGGKTFYVRVLEEGGGYSDWVETEEPAFAIFAEGWDMSNLISGISDALEDLQVVGSEEVEGVMCDVIKAKPDIAKLIESRKEMLSGLENISGEMIEEFTKDIPPEVKIWVGKEDSLPYRIAMTITINIDEAGVSQKMVVETTESVSRYGETISPPIEAPI